MIKMRNVIITGLLTMLLPTGLSFATGLTITTLGGDVESQNKWWVNMKCDIDPLVRSEVPVVPVYSWTATAGTSTTALTDKNDNLAKLTVTGPSAMHYGCTVKVTVKQTDATKPDLTGEKYIEASQI
jgi:hypothetical protein